MNIRKFAFCTLMFVLISLSWFYYIGGEFGTTGVNTSPISSFTDLKGFEWAVDAINYLSEKGILNGLDSKTFSPKADVTREQLAKMLVLAFDIPTDADIIYSDVPADRWSGKFISAASPYMETPAPNQFQPMRPVTREEAASAIVQAAGLSDAAIEDKQVLTKNFPDGMLVAQSLENDVIIAYENNLISGIDGKLAPYSSIRRADIAVMLYRGMMLDKQATVKMTPITGKSRVSESDAAEWAKERGAAECFIEAAPIYWKYGEESGMRADVLYCQAAKETNFGHYTGQVTADMNNWAGIKKADADGDDPEDHESFDTPDDGVRAHFNHMSAYVGTEPIGNVHGRYSIATSRSWSGSVKYVEELGGKWAPDENYGKSIVNDYLNDMIN